MKDNTNYFVPDIEDIHVGYECEILYWEGQIQEKYRPYVVEAVTIRKSKFSSAGYLSDLFDVNAIRVPYLTKEQIEAEGWKEHLTYPSGEIIFINKTTKDGQELLFKSGQHLMVITHIWWDGLNEKVHRKQIYSGECQDINTLRKITKLLGI